MPILSRAVSAGLCLLALGAGSLQAEPGQPVASAAPRAATAATRAVLAEAAKSLPAEDGADFEFSRRGFIATWPEQIIRQANGKPSFDLSGNDFIEGPAPDTVNPALWRQNRVLRAEGLFRLAPGLYQVRNFDNSNVTFIETPKGWIVIDPLTVEEVAKAAFDLLKKHVLISRYWLSSIPMATPITLRARLGSLIREMLRRAAFR